jgi:hypothetical protein
MIEVEKLKSAGFAETTYEGQDGVFLTKKMSVMDMPYYREHVVDNQILYEDDIAVIEVGITARFPNGGIQMVAEGTDYIEEMTDVNSEDGISLLREAGVTF